MWHRATADRQQCWRGKDLETADVKSSSSHDCFQIKECIRMVKRTHEDGDAIATCGLWVKGPTQHCTYHLAFSQLPHRAEETGSEEPQVIDSGDKANHKLRSSDCKPFFLALDHSAPTQPSPAPSSFNIFFPVLFRDELSPKKPRSSLFKIFYFS